MKIRCEKCEYYFERDDNYLKQKRADPLFKWKKIICDSCICHGLDNKLWVCGLDKEERVRILAHGLSRYLIDG